jgi:hypothetical protein
MAYHLLATGIRLGELRGGLAVSAACGFTTPDLPSREKEYVYMRNDLLAQ